MLALTRAAPNKVICNNQLERFGLHTKFSNTSRILLKFEYMYWFPTNKLRVVKRLNNKQNLNLNKLFHMWRINLYLRASSDAVPRLIGPAAYGVSLLNFAVCEFPAGAFFWRKVPKNILSYVNFPAGAFF